jgi:ribosome recycling factor
MEIINTKDLMKKSLDAFKTKLVKIRAGRASLDIIKDIKVNYYGSQMPLNQVATLSLIDTKTIDIAPWEKSMIEPISKSILDANMGLNPQNDGKSLKIIFPPLTEERRRDFVKLAKKELEEAKISLRNIRQKANSAVKASDLSDDRKKIAEKNIQKDLDDFTKLVESCFVEKEREILSF